MSTGREIIFKVRRDELDGGYSASAIGYGIHTQGETLDEVRANVRDAVACYFDESLERPALLAFRGQRARREQGHAHS